MKSLWVFACLLCHLFSVAADASDCSHLIGSCDYYLCREKEHPCGTKGYYLGFAYKYCEKSERMLTTKLSPQGIKWSSETSRCLQESVERISSEEVCSSVQREAIADHDSCYIEAGFCELSLHDRMSIFKTIYKEFRHPQILKQAFELLRECSR